MFFNINIVTVGTTVFFIIILSVVFKHIIYLQVPGGRVQ